MACDACNKLHFLGHDGLIIEKWVRDHKKKIVKNVDEQGTKITWKKQFKSDIVTSPVIQLCLFLSETQKTSTQSSPCLSPRISQSPEEP